MHLHSVACFVSRPHLENDLGRKGMRRSLKYGFVFIKYFAVAVSEGRLRLPAIFMNVYIKDDESR